MKTSGSLITGTLLPRYYDSFANYFVKFVRAYETEGVPVHAITLQNEPNFESTNYPGIVSIPPREHRSSEITSGQRSRAQGSRPWSGIGITTGTFLNNRSTFSLTRARDNT